MVKALHALYSHFAHSAPAAGPGVRFAGQCSDGPGQDVCQADGGAPLVCRAQSGRWTVVGLLTWSLGCQADPQSQHSPGVFLNIANVMDWIISVH